MTNIKESSLANCGSIEPSHHVIDWRSPSNNLAGWERRSLNFFWSGSWFDIVIPNTFILGFLTVHFGFLISHNLVIDKCVFFIFIEVLSFFLRGFEKMHVSILTFKLISHILKFFQSLGVRSFFFFSKNLSPCCDLMWVVEFNFLSYFPTCGGHFCSLVLNAIN